MEEKKEEIRAKPLLNYSFMQEEAIPQQIYTHSLFNNYSLLQMSSNSFSPAPLHNFFSFCRSRSQNDDEYKEWMECQQLYLSWKNMYERLVQSDELYL